MDSNVLLRDPQLVCLHICTNKQGIFVFSNVTTKIYKQHVINNAIIVEIRPTQQAGSDMISI